MPDQWFAAGVQLHAFSIGHAMLLRRLGSPFIAPDAAEDNRLPGFGDVLVAAWVCSRPAGVALQELDGPFQKLWLATKRLTRAGCLERDRLALFRYIAAAHRKPALKLVRQPEGEPSGAPWYGVLISTLCKHYSTSVEEALNTPLATAHWLHAMELEQSGLVRVESEEFKEFVAAADAQRRQFEVDPQAVLDLIAAAQKGKA